MGQLSRKAGAVAVASEMAREMLSGFVKRLLQMHTIRTQKTDDYAKINTISGNWSRFG
jgi:hypothetical protein